jgi:tetratricopeptide (TPR) repeat protein
LRHVRCCGLDPASLPNADSLETLNPLAMQTTQLLTDKKPLDAEALALKLLDLAPNHRAALRVLFEIRRAASNFPATEALARRIAALPDGNPGQVTAANLQLAQILISRSRHADAEPAARIALKTSPRDGNTHHILGIIFTETGKLALGEHHYRRAIELLEVEDGMVLGNLAWNLKLQGSLAEAAAAYDQAIALRPDNYRAIGGYAQVEAGRANLPKAAALLDGALTRFPADRTLRLLRALTDLAQNQPDAVLARLNDAPETLLPAEHIARGQAYDRLGQIAPAITAFATAKQMQRDRFGQRYDPDPLIKKSEHHKAFFTSDKLAALPRAASTEGPQPIFIIGFPHSGTSLLEQLLAKIPTISAADNYAPIADLISLPQLADYPENLTDTLIGEAEKLPNQLRIHFQASLKAGGLIDTETKFATHRTASNFWHLGLIKLLFPDAPIIHVLRHPFDVMVGNFMQDKKLEANCNVSLTALAQHYALTMSLIRHYRGQLTLRYLPIRYEALVTNPAAVLRTVLDFTGINPAAMPAEPTLRANAISAATRLPSHAIAQEPIHARGIFRHLKYQEAAPNLFTEIRPILEPWITELGYKS